MKRSINVAVLLFWTSALSAQTSYQVRAVSYEFLPDTVHMLAGDTILFRPTGAHDMTEIDSLDWVLLQPFWNGGFATPSGVDTDFVVTTPGTHYFICAAHSFTGMRGVLIVDSMSTGSLPLQEVRELHLSPNPAHDRTFLQVPAGLTMEHVEIVDASGRVMRDVAGSPLNDRWPIPLDGLAPGVYQLRARSKGRPVGSARLVVR